MQALSPIVFVPFTIIGILAAYLGWRLVRRHSSRPARALRVLVPLLLVLSFAPDILAGISRAVPGSTLTGVIALMMMHIVAVLVAVPVFLRVAPVQ